MKKEVKPESNIEIRYSVENQKVIITLECGYSQVFPRNWKSESEMIELTRMMKIYKVEASK